MNKEFVFHLYKDLAFTFPSQMLILLHLAKTCDHLVKVVPAPDLGRSICHLYDCIPEDHVPRLHSVKLTAIKDLIDSQLFACPGKNRGSVSSKASADLWTYANLIGIMGHLTWWPLLGLLSLYPVLWSSPCNSFGDWAPVDFICWCSIFKCVAVTWLKDRAPG